MSSAENARVRDGIVAEAMGWLATPYRHQASAKGQGADCLGLVRGVYRAVYGAEPENPPPYKSVPRAWGAGEPLLAAAQRHLRPRSAPAPGDVLLFRLHRTAPVSHCGIMVTPDRFIHAYHARGVVTSAYAPYWQRRLAAVFSFPEVS